MTGLETEDSKIHGTNKSMNIETKCKIALAKVITEAITTKETAAITIGTTSGRINSHSGNINSSNNVSVSQKRLKKLSRPRNLKKWSLLLLNLGNQNSQNSAIIITNKRLEHNQPPSKRSSTSKNKVNNKSKSLFKKRFK